MPFLITVSTDAKSGARRDSYRAIRPVVGGNAGNADPANPRAKSIRVKSVAPVPRVSIYVPCFRFHPRDTMATMKWINALRMNKLRRRMKWNLYKF